MMMLTVDQESGRAGVRYDALGRCLLALEKRANTLPPCLHFYERPTARDHMTSYRVFDAMALSRATAARADHRASDCDRLKA